MTGESPAITPRAVIEAFVGIEADSSLELVYDVAETAGIGDQPLRLALRRMTSAGEIEVTGRGRKAVARLTDAGRTKLTRDRLGLHLALTQDEGSAEWDGNWRLLAVSTAETHRNERDLLRRELLDAGAVSISTGLFITPHDLTGYLSPTHQLSLVRATASQVEIQNETDPRAIAEMLWPAAPIVRRYRDLEATLETVSWQATRTHDEALVAQLRLVAALEGCLRDDPLIPPELRVQPWSVSTIRQAWLYAWNELAAKAPSPGIYPGWLP